MSHYCRISTYIPIAFRIPCWCQWTLFYHCNGKENPHTYDSEAPSTEHWTLSPLFRTGYLLLLLLIFYWYLLFSQNCLFHVLDFVIDAIFVPRNQFWQWRWIKKLNNQRRIQWIQFTTKTKTYDLFALCNWLSIVSSSSWSSSSTRRRTKVL